MWPALDSSWIQAPESLVPGLILGRLFLGRLFLWKELAGYLAGLAKEILPPRYLDNPPQVPVGSVFCDTTVTEVPLLRENEVNKRKKRPKRGNGCGGPFVAVMLLLCYYHETSSFKPQAATL